VRPQRRRRFGRSSNAWPGLDVFRAGRDDDGYVLMFFYVDGFGIENPGRRHRRSRCPLTAAWSPPSNYCSPIAVFSAGPSGSIRKTGTPSTPQISHAGKWCMGPCFRRRRRAVNRERRLRFKSKMAERLSPSSLLPLWSSWRRDFLDASVFSTQKPPHRSERFKTARQKGSAALPTTAFAATADALHAIKEGSRIPAVAVPGSTTRRESHVPAS